MQLEFWSEAGRAAFAAASYEDWSEMKGGFLAKRLSTVRVDVASTSRTIGTCKDPVLRMARTVSVVKGMRRADFCPASPSISPRQRFGRKPIGLPLA